MSVQVRTINNAQSKGVEQVGDGLVQWLMQDHDFALKQKGWQDSKYVVSVNKTGFLRQISGLVFEYKIEMSKTDNSVVVVVDTGDIRKQLAALGVAWFVAWPMLVTAGVGMYTGGEFGKEIIAKVETLLSA